MRILQITDDLPPHHLGGSARIVWETSLGLHRLGHELHILTAAPDGTFPSTKNDIAIHTIPERPKRWAHYRSVFSKKRKREVMKFIRSIRPDIIHAHGLAWQIGYRWIEPAAATGIPVIYTAHGTMITAYGKVLDGETYSAWNDCKHLRWEINPLRNTRIHRALDHCTVLCVSDTLRAHLESSGFKNMTTVRNGINIDFWKPGLKADARRELKIPTDRAVFLFAGRIGHDKGSTALDRALPENVLLLVAGQGRLDDFPHSRARIQLLPNQSTEQMRMLYTACDAAVIPSIYLDPLPTVCLESMACARPVIATHFGGAKEVVVDGVTGWIVNPNDEAALKEKLQWCVDHRSELSLFGEAARKHAEENFSLSGYLSKLLEIYGRAQKAQKL